MTSMIIATMAVAAVFLLIAIFSWLRIINGVVDAGSFAGLVLGLLISGAILLVSRELDNQTGSTSLMVFSVVLLVISWVSLLLATTSNSSEAFISAWTTLSISFVAVLITGPLSFNITLVTVLLVAFLLLGAFALFLLIVDNEKEGESWDEHYARSDRRVKRIWTLILSIATSMGFALLMIVNR